MSIIKKVNGEIINLDQRIELEINKINLEKDEQQEFFSILVVIADIEDRRYVFTCNPRSKEINFSLYFNGLVKGERTGMDLLKKDTVIIDGDLKKGTKEFFLRLANFYNLFNLISDPDIMIDYRENGKSKDLITSATKRNDSVKGKTLQSFTTKMF